ncbi:MAG: hypothetical protein KJZ93_16755 [Caldilineaceae bacterium]|nr:hypothetical protein [Caldilineaceae bacterium]
MTTQDKSQQSNLIWGAILVAGGILLLLSNLNLFGPLTALMWTLLFGGAGIFFLYLFLTAPEQRWWAAIPGCVLLGLGMVTSINELGPRFLAPISGSVFLFSIGVGFMLVYLAQRQNWWAVIPAGVMTTLAVVAGIDNLGLRWVDSGAIFFVGLGVTFLVLGFLPTSSGKELRWAFIPGVVLISMGILIGTPFISVLGYLWPLALIVGGALLIWRQLRERQAE